ncbi:MAG: alpha-glucosidase/alpha-galactosidase [Chloroflexi bacterium]|nr:alpha-glucosidase/alpha-galactosidase [Chloroflexota bacterium]
MYLNSKPLELKIAYIGGGSRQWARKLMYDLALCPDLAGQVALYDLDLESARLNEEFGNWLHASRQPGVVSRWHYTAIATLEETLRGADFVVLSIQPGSLEVMGEEIAIAERYDMFFPVGDTTGAPGLVRGLRSALIYADFARAIAAQCPNAWVINYTNPMTICTRTLTRVEPRLNVFGCCHEVFGTQHLLASLVEKYLGVSPMPARQEIQVNVAGINHFTWIDRAFYRDLDLLALVRRHIAEPGVLREYTRAEVESWNDWFRSAHQIKFELFKRYGLLGAAGDRHLAEFLPGFTRSPEELFRWGVIRTPVSGYRIERWRDAPQQTREVMTGRVPLALDASGEEGVAQMRALLGLGDLVTNVNIENVGQISNLPLRAVVETNARFSRDQVQPVVAGALPPGVHALVAQHVADQEMIVEAALSRDKDLAFQAVLNDPTNRLPLDETWEMFGEMLQASRAFLPGWDI